MPEQTAPFAHSESPRLLEARDLRVHFLVDDGAVPAVDGVSFAVDRGRTCGLVGESGCGKTVTALSLLRLVPPPGQIVGGEVLFDGQDLLRLPEAAMCNLRGAKIAMIFQEPTTALNPVFTVGDQIAEAVRAHLGGTRRAAWERAVEMLRLVEIPEPVARARAYPHQLSGGMRQRVMIAMALACRPQLLIADEPTTALDVTIQAQILALLSSLRARLGMAMLLITHDLGIVAQEVDEVVIMYAGKVVERASRGDIFRSPLHPYTVGLLASLPRLGGGKRRLEAIPGTVPDLRRLPSGCRFRDRCPLAVAECADAEPVLEEKGPSHWVACVRV